MVTTADGLMCFAGAETRNANSLEYTRAILALMGCGEDAVMNNSTQKSVILNVPRSHVRVMYSSTARLTQNHNKYSSIWAVCMVSVSLVFALAKFQSFR